ncbi:MAG: M1 family aminopeptidase [Candidatus Zixiibacteriota bacterium]
MKRFLFVLLLGFFVLSFWSGSSVALAQNLNVPQKEAIYTDQNTTPSQFHQMEAAMKQQRLNEIRKLGIALPLKETKSQGDFDARYYRLDLSLNDTTQILTGAVYLYGTALINGFNVVELNFFDNAQMYVDSCISNSAHLSFTWSSNLIRIFLNATYNAGQSFGVTVYYHGHPLEGGLQSFDWSSHGSPSYPVMCTLSEPYFAQSWWPCKDLPRDKADSVDINVTVRSDLYVASNGLLREIVNNGSTKTYKWHEKYPITTYLVMLAATNYSIFSNWYNTLAGDSIPVIYYVYPERLSQAQSLYPITPSMIRYYAETFGEYPWVEEKYGMAHFTWGGAMEHQTCTSISSSWYSEWVIAHELAHQWWGDYITCHNWHHIWLNEGFASYCEALWAEHNGGSSSYHSYMNSMQFWGGGSIFIQDTTDAWGIFGSIVYDKGAQVLHMLRRIVGDSTSFRIFRDFYSDPRYANGVAETEDFQGICEAASGMDLDYFFQEWIYGTYYPKYRYSFMTEPAGGGSATDVYIHIDQTQTTNPTHFTMPVDLRVTSSSKDTIAVAFNDPRHKDFKVRVPGTNVSVNVDPNVWILRTVSSTTYGMNIVTTDLPAASQFSAYAETLWAKGGTPQYKWKLDSGNLPDGLELDSLTGVISGVPTVQDSFDFTIKVTDSTNPIKTDTQQLYITVGESPFIRGDANHDGLVDISDVIYLINNLYAYGPDPLPYDSGDLNCNGIIDVADIIYLLNYLFKSGPAPC